MEIQVVLGEQIETGQSAPGEKVQSSWTALEEKVKCSQLGIKTLLDQQLGNMQAGLQGQP